MAVGVLAYPSALDSRSTLLEAANLASTKLASAYTPGSGTMLVQDASAFPATGVLVVDGEILYYSGKTATSFTGVQDGREGTFPSTHAAGRTVANRITSGYMDLRADAIIALENKVGVGAQSIPDQITAASTKPAGTGTELQYRLNGNAFGAVPSSVTGSNIRFMGDLRVDGNYSMVSGAGGTYFSVLDMSNTVNPVSIFYAINTAGNPRFIYFGRGYPFGTPPMLAPQYQMFYTGTIGTEDVRRMYLSPVGSLVINQQALANQAAALTVNQNGNTAFTKAFQCNGIGEISVDPTTPMGLATKQYVDSKGISLSADYAWTGNHSWTKPLGGNLMLGAGVKLILNTSEVKIGAAGSGPGGVGRALYVD